MVAALVIAWKSRNRARTVSVRPGAAPAPQPRSDARSEPRKDTAQEFGVSVVAAERPLCADRRGSPAGNDTPRITIPGERVQVPSPVRADPRCEERYRCPRQFSDRGNPKVGKLSKRHRPNAPEVPNRKGMEKVQLRAGRDDEGAVRLRYAARDLGQELRLRPSHGHRQTGFLPHALSDRLRNRGRRPEEMDGTADVNECLVDGYRLNERTEIPEDVEDAVAEVDVVTECSVDHDQPGAELAGLPDPHGSPDTHCPGLIRCRENDPAAHGDRLADEVRAAEKYHRRIEGIEVGVEDGGLA